MAKEKHNQHHIVIMDGTGRRIYRGAVHARLWGFGLVAFVVLFLTTLGIASHSFAVRDKVAEATVLAQENAELEELLTVLDAYAPEHEARAERLKQTLYQVHAKSGLGKIPMGVSMGPLSESVGIDLEKETDTENVDAWRTRSTVILGQRLQAMGKQGMEVQSSLNQLQEYFHDAKQLLLNTPSITPTAARAKTSSFGRRRDPVHGDLRLHKGVDFGGPVGTPIYAPANGVVIFVGRRGGYGQTVVIDHGYGLQTHFAHLSRYRCEVGDRVRRGELIADMGSTGKSTGPHLHYEVRRMGHPIDPERFILDR